MIYDCLCQLDRYAKINPDIFGKITAFLKTVTPQTPAGRQILIPETLMADVLYYETKTLDACKVELHRRYVDVQVILAGEETVCCLPVDGLEVLEPMNVGKDRGFFVYQEGKGISLPLKAGMFAFFFPGEGHLTGLNPAKCAIRKVVFKIDSSIFSK